MIQGSIQATVSLQQYSKVISFASNFTWTSVNSGENWGATHDNTQSEIGKMRD